MKNRAKCRRCQDVIESNEHIQFTSCKCGAISIDSNGACFMDTSNDLSNYIPVDDEGHHIMTPITETPQNVAFAQSIPIKPTKEEIIGMLDEMILRIENLPPYAKEMPINHYDFASMLLMLSAFLRVD